MLLNKKKELRYVFFGSSTIISRGLEYLVLIFLASYFSKEIYGRFELYKKIIELTSCFLAFGFPTLIMTYTKSSLSKINFTLLSILFSAILLIIIIPIFSYWNILFLIIPILFYTHFFYSGSIIQSFNLVYLGSQYAGYYKLIVSFLFSLVIFLFAYYFNYKYKSLINACYLLYLIMLIRYIFIFYNYLSSGLFDNIKKYSKLFFKILFSSFTLVVTNFVSMAFLYTDIFIINLLDINPMPVIGDYSFVLNIANVLLIIPLTIVQVDINNVKYDNTLIINLIKKIKKYILLFIIPVIIIYLLLTNLIVHKFDNTTTLFILVIFAKIFQALTIPYGFFLIIKKDFSFNLMINILSLVLNIVLSYLLYNSFGVYAIAFVSIFVLAFRYLMLKLRLRSEFIKLRQQI